MKKTTAKKPALAAVPPPAAPVSPDVKEAEAKLEHINGLMKVDGQGLGAAEKALFGRLRAQVARNSQAQQQGQQAQQVLQQAQAVAAESGVQMNLLVDLLWESKQRAAAPAATPDVD